jgi:Flp pilus assembly protein TadG
MSTLRQALSRWSRDHHGHAAIIFAFMAPVMIFAVGMAVDYGIYSRTKARLNMLADEAALSAVSSAAMQQTSAQAQSLAQNILAGQAAQYPRFTLVTNPPSVTISYDSANVVRTATVSYSGTYSPIFAKLLGPSTLPISGTSVAQSSSLAAPNMNFYVLLDNSGSMALPATQAGITQMQSLTTAQISGGCAFACHEAAPNNPAPGLQADNIGNPCATGTSGRNCQPIDNYQVARNNNITLRFDEVASAVSSLMSTASTYQGEMSPAPTYQLAVYSVDAPYQQGIYGVMPLTSSFVSNWSADSSKLQLYTVYSDGASCATSGSNPCGAAQDTLAPGSGAGTNASWEDVGFFSSRVWNEMQWFEANIPTPGTGASGAAPQEVLFWVTDGVEDQITSSSLSITALDSTSLTACTAMKDNGVKIAILYTTYYPTPGMWLYDDYVANFQSSIPTQLQSCASPGLFMTAGLNDNLSSELQALFQVVIQSARLTK